MRIQESIRTAIRRRMAFEESSATALVRLTGLAIICLNGAAQRCEVGIIRDSKHQLTIKILKPFNQAGTNIVQYQEVASYQQLPKEDVRVEIKAQGAPVAGYQTYENGNFNRLGSNDPNDPNDFRWLVDMQALHGNTLSKTVQKRYPLSNVYLHNALLYTHQLDQQLFFDKVTKDANGIASSPQPFGKVAKTMGAQINGAEVSLTIQIGADPPQTHVLPRIPNLQYIIEIKNIDYNLGAAYSDMPDYYKYIASPSGNQVELRPGKEGVNPGVFNASPRSIQSARIRQGAEGAKPGVVAEKPVNQVDFCHPVVFPLPSIDLL